MRLEELFDICLAFYHIWRPLLWNVCLEGGSCHRVICILKRLAAILPDFIKPVVFDASDAVWWNPRAQPLRIFGVMKSWMEAEWDQGVVFDMNSVSEAGGGGGRRGATLSSSCQTCFSTLINHLKRSLCRSALEKPKWFHTPAVIFEERWNGRNWIPSDGSIHK